MGWNALAHLRWHPFVGLCWHDGIIIAVPPVPTPKMPHVTFNVLNGLFLGALPSTADGGEVRGPLGIPFMGRTNDAGFITPHVSIPPNNSLLPLTILLGGSESMLGSSKVKIRCHNLIWGDDEYDMAACTLPFIPLSTNFGCNEPLFVPLDFVVSPNTVMVGLSLVDLLTMALDLVLAALLDGVMELGSSAVSRGLKKVKGIRAAKKLGKVSAIGEEAYQKALKQADLDAALRDGLRKQRARVMGTPAPPPKPAKRVLDAARKAGDEAFNKASKEAFGPGAKKAGRLGRYLDPNQLRLGGRLRPVMVAGVKVVLGEMIDSVAPEPAGFTSDVEAGEEILATAGA